MNVFWGEQKGIGECQSFYFISHKKPNVCQKGKLEPPFVVAPSPFKFEEKRTRNL